MEEKIYGTADHLYSPTDHRLENTAFDRTIILAYRIRQV